MSKGYTSKRTSTLTRAYARKVVTDFEDIVYEEAHAGAGHPDLFEWHRERLAAARERMILRLMGLDVAGMKGPPRPEVSYDR